jgi:hypothetical protein
MNTIAGTYQQGRIVLRSPVDWPEGTRVEVMLVEPGIDKMGMTEEEWPSDPQGIAELLARMDQCEPLEMTAEEQADLAAWRQKVKERSLTKMRQSWESSE